MNAFDRRMKAALRHTSGNCYLGGASLARSGLLVRAALLTRRVVMGVADGDPNSGESGLRGGAC
ncbi:hypothetical protein RB2516 [Rhodopirellula baltica SH 1]|uniref:Uncharacterized protein n=1 Tax=Rhodopirellula baltica (strain DSM 10527 / NCIMB 13988 / SH1) TaxID=243090 RepID=Q7UVN5_RHOBA|nr:hypothetical protein RB2516 [Rhodopirellula baltica SH 1]